MRVSETTHMENRNQRRFFFFFFFFLTKHYLIFVFMYGSSKYKNGNVIYTIWRTSRPSYMYIHAVSDD